MENYTGKDLIWFVGVVEDRQDPERLGRVRVRCLGHHTEDKTKIPTPDLAWSTVMAPTTSPSMDGMGHTPSFLVEGSWVTGFFLDAYRQESVIVGSLPGFNSELDRDEWTLENRGFRDPNGAYPRQSDSDVSRLARGQHAESHDSLITRRKNRITDIPKATKPYIKTVESVAVDPRQTWEEPHPKSNTYSQYPYNHVTESESGHVFEVDDSPGGERIMNYHRTGTFDEIHPDGSKMTKIVGTDYEIVLRDRNVSIEGSCNLTIGGACRTLIKGDYILEVEGNYTEKIHKNHFYKIGVGKSGGNEAFEVRGNRTGNINKNDNLRVMLDQVSHINANYIKQVNGTYDLSVVKDMTLTVMKSYNLSAFNNISLAALSSNFNATAGGAMTLSSTGRLHIQTPSQIRTESGTEIKETAPVINMN
jgi:hypothetical protein